MSDDKTKYYSEVLKSTLRVGDSGSDVHVLQALLGVPWLTQTGTFDDTTEYLVKAFQMASGLYPDGIVRGDTWAALTKKA